MSVNFTWSILLTCYLSAAGVAVEVASTSLDATPRQDHVLDHSGEEHAATSDRCGKEDPAGSLPAYTGQTDV